MLKTLRIYCNNFPYSLPKSDKEIENRVFLKRPTSMPSIWLNAIYKIKTLTCIQVQGSDKTVRIPAGLLCLFAETPLLKSFSTLLLFYNFKRLRKIFDLVLLWVPNMTDFLYVLVLPLKQAYIFLLQLTVWPTHTCLMLLNLICDF